MGGNCTKDNITTQSNIDNIDILIFLAQERATEIRENKNHQRDVLYQFVFILAAVFGLFEILKNNFKVAMSYCIFKLIAIIFGILAIYILYRTQKSLAYYRKRLSKIWDQQPFAFAFEKKILKYPKEKRKYYSFWYNFWEFTVIYMLIVVLVIIIVFFLK